MKYILALDQGTTSSRAILFNTRTEGVAVAQQEFEQIFPQSGWVEHRPEDIWNSQRAAAEKALEKAGAKPGEVVAVGITNQRETTLVWDRRSGRPVCNAIVWQDRRTADSCARLKNDGLEDVFLKKCGLPVDPYFSGTKIKWILDNVPGTAARAAKGELAFGTVDTWLLWNLTGGKVHATDASNASRTLLFNIHTGQWDEELLKILGIPASLLPEVRDSSGTFGEIAGIPSMKGVPVTGIAGDQQAALFGQCCFRPGMVKNTYGTGCFLLMFTGEKAIASENKLLTTVAWRLNGKLHYALEGSIFVAGAAVQWLRDQLGIIKTAADIEPLAAKVTDSGGVVFVPAFTGLGAPHWDPYARGIIAGISRGTSAAHLARATLEAIAFQTLEVAHAMETDAGIAICEMRADGGASRNNLLMQIQSDLLQKKVVRPVMSETTALGAAALAGLATGFWKSEDDLEKHWAVDRVFAPAAAPETVRTQFALWEESVRRAAGRIKR
ncbi:MAG: glycerol kinase GlpK [Kiritimatiellia bacterium]